MQSSNYVNGFNDKSRWDCDSFGICSSGPYVHEILKQNKTKKKCKLFGAPKALQKNAGATADFSTV